MFKSQHALDVLKKRLRANHNEKMIEEIEDEYFPLVDQLEKAFVGANFQTVTAKLGSFVWYLQATIAK